MKTFSTMVTTVATIFLAFCSSSFAAEIGVCDTPVPLLDDLPDSHLRGSTRRSNDGGARSRYSVTGTPQAWITLHDDTEQWLHADLGASTFVSSVSTKGRGDADQWVESYKVMYSQDGFDFVTIQDETTGQDKIFNGNTDRNTEVTHDLGITARYLRVNPQTYQPSIALRWSVQGCRAPTCISPPPEIGVCDTVVPLLDDTPNFALAASSVFTLKHGPWRSRFNISSAPKAWIPKHAGAAHNAIQWIQADFGVSTFVSSVSTKGRGDAYTPYQWTESYKIMHSQDGFNFTTIQDEATGQDKIFSGNSDRNTVVTHDLGITARYVRLNPQEYHTYMAIRWSFQGCRLQPCIISPPVSTKKGVNVPYENYRCDDLTKLTGISIWYTEFMKVVAAVDGPCSDLPVQEHVSMMPYQYGADKVGDWIPDGTNYLMGFRDPNSELGANITGKKAARKWKDVEASLNAAGRSDVMLLTPSASMCTENCINMNALDWYQEFFDNCNASALNCRIDGLASHYWDCDPAMMAGYITQLYTRFQKKIWMTLYPCPLARTADETMGYMKAMIDVLEYSEIVEKYFWIATRMPEGGSKINQLLEDNSSDLTPVGEVYNSYLGN